MMQLQSVQCIRKCLQECGYDKVMTLKIQYCLQKNLFLLQMRTIKRQYVFLADTAEYAHKWVDIIQSRITS